MIEKLILATALWWTVTFWWSVFRQEKQRSDNSDDPRPFTIVGKILVAPGSLTVYLGDLVGRTAVDIIYQDEEKDGDSQ